MQSSVLYPCLFYKLDSNCFQGIQVTQVYDTLGGGNEAFGALGSNASLRLELLPFPSSSTASGSINTIWRLHTSPELLFLRS